MDGRTDDAEDERAARSVEAMRSSVRREREAEAERLVRMVKTALPDLKCRWCGNDRFGLVDNPVRGVTTSLTVDFDEHADDEVRQAYRRIPLITLICERCGHLERFAEPQMRSLAAERSETDVGDG